MRDFLLVQAPITLLASSAGVWLFYVQHQFEHTYWERGADWNLHTGALHGSSHYDLPPVLRWFAVRARWYQRIVDGPVVGTQLIREWRGVEHKVAVLADGFEYEGRRYRSFSAVARAITGTRWNGPVFFGLRGGKS